MRVEGGEEVVKRKVRGVEVWLDGRDASRARRKLEERKERREQTKVSSARVGYLNRRKYQ